MIQIDFSSILSQSHSTSLKWHTTRPHVLFGEIPGLFWSPLKSFQRAGGIDVIKIQSSTTGVWREEVSAARLPRTNHSLASLHLNWSWLTSTLIQSAGSGKKRIYVVKRGHLRALEKMGRTNEATCRRCDRKIRCLTHLGTEEPFMDVTKFHRHRRV